MPSYPYEYVKKVYNGIPFAFKITKDRYWDYNEAYTYTGSPIYIQMWAYNPLTLSSEQISGSLMTVSITSGQLPNMSYCSTTLGCLATEGQSYSVETSSGTATAVGLLPSGVVDDGTEKTWNLFYNYSTQTFLLDTTATKSGYVWVGDITIPAHAV